MDWGIRMLYPLVSQQLFSWAFIFDLSFVSWAFFRPMNILVELLLVIITCKVATLSRIIHSFCSYWPSLGFRLFFLSNLMGDPSETCKLKVKIWSTLSKELTAGRIHPRGHRKNIWLMQLFAVVKWRAVVILFHTPNDANTLWLTSYNHCFQFQLAVIIYFLHSSCANQYTRCGEWLLPVQQSVTRPDPKTTFISLSLRSERLKVKETHAGRATKTFIFWCKMKIWPL